jgi:hypothetical protein
MCEPEAIEMLDKAGNCLISYAYKVKADSRDVGDLKYWTDSVGEHEARSKLKERSYFSLA